MNEHFALSKAQKDYLNGHITLKNPTTEKSRIRKKPSNHGLSLFQF